jgi:hypothetical protein
MTIRSTRPLAHLTAAPALALALGCATAPPPARSYPGEVRRPAATRPVGTLVPDSVSTRRSRGGLHRKLVSAKEEPFTLVAADGTRCEVREKTYRKLEVGDRARCLWHDAAEQ